MAKLCVVLPALVIVVLTTAAAGGVEDLTIGGRFMQDYTVWGSVDDELEAVVGEQLNGTEIRRARLCAKGSINQSIDFKVNWDFAGGEETCLKDAYLEISGLPGVGNARVGHFNEPFCLDELTSSKYVAFVERASVNAFAPGRNSGLMLHDALMDDRLVWQAGVFRTVDDAGTAAGDDGVSFGGRVAGLVLGDADGPRGVHLGVSANRLTPEGGEVRFRQRPEIHMSERFVDTGAIPADAVLRLGAEVGGVFGPVHFAGEYIMTNVTGGEYEDEPAAREQMEDSSFSGFYAQAGYFLTGETRAYGGGQWGRTKPARALMQDGGLGAFEIVARYSSLDLNDEDAGVAGCAMDDITLGLNWYMHGNARWMVNYVMSTVSDGAGEEIGSATALVTRFQFDF